MIKTISEFRSALRYGQYAWPGCYPKYFITSDGAALSFDSARKNIRLILDSIHNDINDGWKIVAVEINYEDNELVCDHSSEIIESAYGTN